MDINDLRLSKRRKKRDEIYDRGKFQSLKPKDLSTIVDVGRFVFAIDANTDIRQ